MTIIESLQKFAADNFAEKFKAKIIEALAEKGFLFNDEADFIEFAQSRLTIVRLPNDYCTLVVDAESSDKSVQICTWIDKFDISTHANTVTATYSRQLTTI